MEMIDLPSCPDYRPGMDRRRFLLTSLAGALAAPVAVEAQQARKIYRIGVLSVVPRAANSELNEAILQGLRDRGYVEGRNMALEYRFAHGRPERLPDMAAELARLNVDVILAANDAHVRAARRATTTIPIVMFLAADPVGEGLVASLARPGGNVTGLTTDVSLETWGKRLQLLTDLVLKISRVAILSNDAFRPNAARWKATQDAAHPLGISLIRAAISGSKDLPNAFATIARSGTQGVLVFHDPLTYERRVEIAELAAKHRVPTVYPFKE